jgi:acyl-CoA synthetase (AMP-forming)/AMP-acid ligase II
MNDVCNIAATLPGLASRFPDRIAMRCPGTRGPDGLARFDQTLTYRDLDARSDAIAAGLAGRGIVRGTRTVVMVRPSPEFFLLMFALFKAGAVPVLVDPGIDKRALKQCLDEAQPQAFIGIPLAHVARVLLGWAKSARIRITTGGRAWLADATLAEVERAGSGAGIVRAYTSLTAAKSAMSARKMVVFTTRSKLLPAASSTAARFANERSACAATPSARSPVAGSAPSWPAVKTRPAAATAWLYAPAARGAASVRTMFRSVMCRC